MTLSRRRALTALGAAALPWSAWAKSPPPPATASLAFESFNAATDTPLLQAGSRGAATARVQILLDRAWFSAGEIDAAFGRNLQRALRAYQRANDLRDTGTADAATWQALRAADSAPLLTRYTVTDKDAAGPFAPLPADLAARARLKAMGYATLLEALAERFHVAPAFLLQLNPGVALGAGKDIVVPHVLDSQAPSRTAQSIAVDRREHVLRVLGARDRVVAAFPVSLGRAARGPLPTGRLAIRNVVELPTYTDDSPRVPGAPKGAAKIELPHGPNNPVGTVWLGLTQSRCGIHGTPEPARVGQGATDDGCFHLTNWDAERLAKLIKVGAQVELRD